MRYLIIIARFSLVWLLIVGSIAAQDLEDDELKITSRGIDSLTADMTEEDEQALDALLIAYDVNPSNTPPLASTTDLVKAKQEQLSIVLRKAYYQKLTTPRWASILAADSWRQSFLKWRYFAQLRNYIADMDADLTYFKMTRPVNSFAQAKQKQDIRDENEIGDELAEDEIEDTSVAEDSSEIEKAPALFSNVEAIKAEKQKAVVTTKTASEIEETPNTSIVRKAVNSEESWEKIDKEKIEVKVVTPTKGTLTFSMKDLTLSDNILSEREIYDRDKAIADEELRQQLREDSIQEAKVVALNLEFENDRLREKEKAEKDKAAAAKREAVKQEKAKKQAVQKEKTKNDSPAKKPVTTTTSNAVAAAPTSKSLNKESSNVVTTTTNTPVAVVSNPTVISAGRQAQTIGFERRKGQLSWPVMTGQITERFGLRPTPDSNGLPSRNNGINMSCPPSTSILSVHSGTVMMVAEQRGYDNVVTIKHGDYTSAYYNIASPSVKVGDVVAVGQRIGRLKGGASNVAFHFEVWKDQDRINPDQWLQPR